MKSTSLKVAGFSFIRNAVKYDYPIKEAILSVLPLCDTFFIAVGDSEDETLNLIESINSPKIQIIKTVWEKNLHKGGRAFALETDKAYQAIPEEYDWVVYIQGDECIHEKYHQVILDEIKAVNQDSAIEGLLLQYKHFYGSYDYYAHSRRWYRREVRVMKRLPGLYSYKDAQGFRIEGRKLKVKLIDAFVYHYGWVKPPSEISSKVNNFNQFYHQPEWVNKHFPVAESFDFSNADRLHRFKDSHPYVMQERISQSNWKFSFDPTKQKLKLNLRRKALQWIEDKTGKRLFEYRNYKRIR